VYVHTFNVVVLLY